MRLICLITLSLLLSPFAYAQQNGDSEPYDFQTHLKGGYRIQFEIDDDTEYLYLTKNGKQIAELSSISKGQPIKSLGYVTADFKSCFVLGHSYGSGNPTAIELINKFTGKNILKKAAWWIGADEKSGYLLYSEQDVPTTKDKMILLNMKTKQKWHLAFPKGIFDEPEILGRIEIKAITAHLLVLRYNSHGKTEVEKYAF